jgi:hypothetical protein
MQYFLMPLTDLLKSNGHLLLPRQSGIPTIIMLLSLLGIVIWRGNIGRMRVNPMMFVFAAGVMLQQTFSTLFSKQELPYYRIFNENLIIVLLWIIIYFLTYVFIQQMIQTPAEQLRFLKGVLIALGINYIVVGIEFIWLTTGHLEVVVEWIGQHLESHIYEGHGFYSQGSYVQTSHRINGLEMEASFFGVQIAILTFPLILAGIKTKMSLFKRFGEKGNQILYHVLFTISIGVLIVAKTSTGLVMAALAICCLVGIYLSQYGRKAMKVVFGLLGLIGLMVAVLYFGNQTVHNFLDTFIFQKALSGSVAVRLSTTIGYFSAFLHAPLLGVGYADRWAFILAPKGALHNIAEYYNQYLPGGELPMLSIMAALFARFGLVIVSVVIGFLYIRVRRYRRAIQIENQPLVTFNYHMFLFYLVFMAVGSFFLFEYQKEVYIWLFMYFLVSTPGVSQVKNQISAT